MLRKDLENASSPTASVPFVTEGKEGTYAPVQQFQKITRGTKSDMNIESHHHPIVEDLTLIAAQYVRCNKISQILSSSRLYTMQGMGSSYAGKNLKSVETIQIRPGFDVGSAGR